MQIRPAAEMPLPPRRRRPVVVLLLMLLVALLAAVYTGWWLAAAGRLRDGALSWIEQRRAEGVRLDFEPPTRVGFPLSVGVSFPNALAALPRADWNWHSQDVQVSAPVIGPRVLTVSLLGDQTLTLPPAVTGGDARRLTGSAENLAIVVDPADASALGQLTARRLSLVNAAGDGFGAGSLDVTLSPASAEEGGSAGGVVLDASEVRLPAAWQTPLGNSVARLDLKARLIGKMGRAVDAAALSAWRDEGGVVEIDRLNVVYGPVGIEADGTLALDRRGQPIGALSTRIQGWQAGLDSLVAANALPAYTAAASKIVLRGLTRGNGQGDGVLAAPLSLQDQTLSLGPVPLLHLPALHWADPRTR